MLSCSLPQLAISPPLMPSKPAVCSSLQGCLLHDLLENSVHVLLELVYVQALRFLAQDSRMLLRWHWFLYFSSRFPLPLPFPNLLPSDPDPLHPRTLFPLFSPSFLTMLPCVYRLQPVLALLSFTLLTQGENCPATCLCPDPHTVDCSGRGLTRLPDEIPLDVRRLLLADNWIPRIPSDFLVLYSDLVYLDLRNNSLSHIEPGTLSTSSRLVFLDLGSNNLTEIPKGTFGESRSLIKLRLGNNPYLSMVNEDAFMGLTSLRELELERNALSGLQVSALSQLPSLRVVRLEGNPWVCNCNFANLFTWLVENSHKLPNGKSLNLTSTIVACWASSYCCINVTVWQDSLLFILLQIKQGTSSSDLNLALSHLYNDYKGFPE